METRVRRDYLYDATLLRVIDGDTIVVDLDLGFRIHWKTSIRLSGINAPELHKDGGAESRDHLIKLLGDSQDIPLVLISKKNPEDKYGRWLAEVKNANQFKLDLPSVNEQMVTDGFAVNY